MRSGAMPSETSSAFALSARWRERMMLDASVPVESVWPPSSMVTPGRPARLAANVVSAAVSAASRVDSAVAKLIVDSSARLMRHTPPPTVPTRMLLLSGTAIAWMAPVTGRPTMPVTWPSLSGPGPWLIQVGTPCTRAVAPENVAAFRLAAATAACSGTSVSWTTCVPSVTEVLVRVACPAPPRPTDRVSFPRPKLSSSCGAPLPTSPGTKPGPRSSTMMMSSPLPALTVSDPLGAAMVRLAKLPLSEEKVSCPAAGPARRRMTSAPVVPVTVRLSAVPVTVAASAPNSMPLPLRAIGPTSSPAALSICASGLSAGLPSDTMGSKPSLPEPMSSAEAARSADVCADRAPMSTVICAGAAAPMTSTSAAATVCTPASEALPAALGSTVQGDTSADSSTRCSSSWNNTLRANGGALLRLEVVLDRSRDRSPLSPNKDLRESRANGLATEGPWMCFVSQYHAVIFSPIPLKQDARRGAGPGADAPAGRPPGSAATGLRGAKGRAGALERAVGHGD